MGHILTVRDGTKHTLLRPEDFGEVLFKYLGSEARDYFQDFLDEYDMLADDWKELDDKCYQLEKKVDELEDKLRYETANPWEQI